MHPAVFKVVSVKLCSFLCTYRSYVAVVTCKTVSVELIIEWAWSFGLSGVVLET